MQMLHGLCSLTSNWSTFSSNVRYGVKEQNITHYSSGSLLSSYVQSIARALIKVGTVGPHSSSAPLQCNKEKLSGYFICKQLSWPKGLIPLPKSRYTACGCVHQRTPDSRDEEFRSARDIALGIHRRYQDVLNGGFSKNLKEFVTACVTAYSVGCTEAGLKKELISASQQLEDANQELHATHLVHLQYKTTAQEVEDCILWLSLVFITILCAPQPTIVRWSQTPAVSPEVQSQWQGFCAIIANAYYNRGMAWLPVKVLQLEQMAVSGHAEEASLVADRMRLVFATLENISPQWPKR